MSLSTNIDACLDALGRLFASNNGWMQRAEFPDAVAGFTADTVQDALAVMEGFGLTVKHFLRGRIRREDWYVWLAPLGVTYRRRVA